MTDPNLTQIWQETLTLLRRQMTQATYEAHLSRATLVAVNGEVVITAPNEMSQEWLEKRLLSQVTAALTAVTGRQIEPEQVTITLAGAEPEPDMDDDLPMYVRSRRKDRRYYIDNEFIDQGYAAHLGPYCLAVYNLLCRRANAQSRAWPGKASIAADLGISKRQVHRCLQQLELYHIIHVERKRKSHNDSWETNSYTLLDLSEWVKLPTSKRRDHDSQESQ